MVYHGMHETSINRNGDWHLVDRHGISSNKTRDLI